MGKRLADFVFEALDVVNDHPTKGVDQETLRAMANEVVSKWQSSHARGSSTEDQVKLAQLVEDPDQPDIFSATDAEPPTLAPEGLFDK